MIPWWNIDLGEEAAAAAARTVRERNLNLGPVVEGFEMKMAELLGVRHIIGSTSCTTAFMMVLYACGIRPGDEVIVPDLTWIAPANAVFMLGASPVLADVEAHSPVLSPAAFEAAITPKTKAVMPVHLSGMSPDMPAIRAIAEKHGIAVIEDAAQSLLVPSVEGGYLGTHSLAGSFSLSISKLLTSGQGGFVATNDNALAEKCFLLRTQGTVDVKKAAWAYPGGNFRYSDLQAAVVLAQIPLLERRIAALKAIHAQYADGLDSPYVEMIGKHLPDGAFQIYFEALCEDRAGLTAYLAEHDIETRPQCPPLHTGPHLAERNLGEFPHASRFASQTIILPSGPDQRLEDIDKVIKCIHEWRPACR